jgi:APA family basic amino acid/polyamine antiporter
VGWNLVLEYLAASSTVAVGWSGYFNNFMTSIGLPIPTAFASAPIAGTGFSSMVTTGTWFNLPAVALVAAVSLFLIIGVKTSANFNNVMVAIKLTIVLVVIFVGFGHMVPANHAVFIPPNTGTFGQFGWSGVFRASGVIFFAYIGFDAVSVAAQEAKNPQRDIPIGILGSLVLCTILYVLMSWVETGIAHYSTLNVAHPVSAALEALPATAWLAPYVNIGAIVGLASVVLVLLLGQSRIFYAMARDGMIPSAFKTIHPRFATPWKGNIITGIVCGIMAGVLPLDLLGELVSIGTLVAFIVVCVGVMILRKRAPHVPRPFKTPFVWVTAPAGIFMCGVMIGFLPLDTWVRFAVWTVVGFVIYFFYSRHHAKPSRYSIGMQPAE